ncbi:MAG TPA: hypothetical protein VFP30_01725 [Candidatus Limnocylindria bacterium]|nr:hypothetical protein [Candidatus Limnocylindria bacterium]
MTHFNASDQDVSRVIRSWLHEDRHEDVSRIAGAVLDRVDTIPQRRVPWWPARRTPVMNKFATIGLGAAAVVVALVVGTQLLNTPDTGPNVGSEPSTPIATDPTPDSTPSATAVAGLPAGPFSLVDWEAGDPVDLPPLTVTIPGPGWDGDENGGILFWHGGGPDEAGMIIFARNEYTVFRDPCRWSTTPETPVTTVDEFVAALAAQEGRDASAPVDITIGGYTGKAITLHVPEDINFINCDQRAYGTWDCGDPGVPDPCGFNEPGETSITYILDVDGTLVAWHTDYRSATPAESVADMEELVLSARWGE